jgi:hypothetical protein
VVFSAKVSNGKHALLAFSASDGLRTLIAAGDEMVMGPGDVRVVANVWVDLSIPPGRRILNDAGDVGLLVTFEDGGAAAMTATTVPEPADALQLAAGALTLWACAPRRRGRSSARTRARRASAVSGR